MGAPDTLQASQHFEGFHRALIVPKNSTQQHMKFFQQMKLFRDMKFLTGQFFFNTWNFFSPTAQIGSFSLAVLEALAYRHYRGHLRFLLKPLDTIMLWYTRFFRRGMSSIEMRMMLYPLGRLYDWLSLRFVSGICGKIYFKIDHLWKVWGHEF